MSRETRIQSGATQGWEGDTSGFAVYCMVCREVYKFSAVAESHGLCDRCLDEKYPEDDSAQG